MKLFTAVFLLLTILGSQATKQQSYQSVLTPTLTNKDKLKTSHFGNAILNMIELGNTVQADFDDLFEALTLLKENLVEKKETEISEFAADEATHNQEVQRLSGLIAGYDADIITYDDELEGFTVEAERLTTVLSSQETQLTNAQNQKTSEEQLLVDLAASYQQQLEDFSGAITLLNQAISTLQTGSSSSTEQGMSSFIQTNQSSFISLGKQIERQSQKLKISQSLTKGVTLFFAQLAANQEPTSESLSQAINALQELVIYYQNGMTALTTNYETQVAEHQALINTLIIQIGELGNTIIPRTEQNISVNTEATESRENLLVLTRTKLSTETENLEQENESWENRTSQHEELLPQYDEEYALVERCETVLRQQNV